MIYLIDKMLFIFEDKNGELYDSPDSYVLSLPHRTIEWGDKITIYPVYVKGSPAHSSSQTIQCMFFHEGATSGLDGTYWVGVNKDEKNWLNSLDIDIVKRGSVVKFDMGPEYPKYFKSVDDLAWYIKHIHPVTKISITDEYSLRME